MARESLVHPHERRLTSIRPNAITQRPFMKFFQTIIRVKELSALKLVRLGAMAMLAAAATLLSGCASVTGYPESPGDPKGELQSLKRTYYGADVVQHYNALRDDAARTAYRDEVVVGRERVIDLNYYAFRKHLLAGGNLTEVGTDWAVLALSGAGTTVASAGSKAIFAAIAGGLTGARGSVEKNLYYQKTIVALVGQMEAQRKQAKLKIEQGLAVSASRYSLTEALGDVDDYYEAGSIPSAVNGVSESAGVSVSVSKEAIAKIREKRISPTQVDGPAPGLTPDTPTDKQIRADIRKATRKIDTDGKIKPIITSAQAAAILKAYDKRVVPETEALTTLARERESLEGEALKKLRNAVIAVLNPNAALPEDPSRHD